MNKDKAELIDKVSRERWDEALEWQQKRWIHVEQQRAKFFKNHIWRVLSLLGLKPKHRGDDWNSWWEKSFEGYNFLPQKVHNAIELGCGPYTNMRRILSHCTPDHLTLSDPLIRTYAGFKLNFTADVHRRRLAMLDDHPIEDLPFRDDYFDLTVMINVLDHVQDARLCMERAVGITKPGGIFVIGQDLSSEEDLEALTRDRGLIGHPIKLNEEWFSPWLEKFEPLLHKVLPRDQGREPHQHYATLIFGGRKKG